MLGKYNISRADFIVLEELIQLEQPYKAGKPWEFAGSFYYATTVLTTIGKDGIQREFAVCACVHETGPGPDVSRCGPYTGPRIICKGFFLLFASDALELDPGGKTRENRLIAYSLVLAKF